MTRNIVWVRTTEDPCEVILPIGKRWAGKEVTLRVPSGLNLSRRIPGPPTDAQAMVTPDFEKLEDGSTIILNERGHLQIYAAMNVDGELEMPVLYKDKLLKTVQFRGIERFRAALVCEPTDSPVSVPRVGSSKPIHVRLFDESDPPCGAAGVLIEVHAIGSNATLIDPKTGTQTRQLSGETNELGRLRTFRAALLNPTTTSTHVHLLVRPMTGGFEGIPLIVPIDLLVEEVIVALPPTTPRDLTAVVGDTPHSRPFDMGPPPPRRSMPLGWMVAVLILVAGIGIGVLGEVLSAKGPLSNAEASMRSGMTTAATKKALETTVPEPVRSVRSEKGDPADIHSVCAQRNPMEWCSSWVIGDTSVEFYDCNKLPADRTCTCPGTTSERTFTYTIARCHKTRVHN